MASPLNFKPFSFGPARPNGLQPFQFAPLGQFRGKHPAAVAEPAQSNPAADSADQVTLGQLPQTITPPPAAVVNDPLRYGDVLTQVFTFTGAGDQLVLPRPIGTRTLLIIENDLAAPNSIRVNFDKIADANTGLRIVAGGNAFFDAVVPQNNIHVFAPVAGNIILTWINAAPTS